MKLKLIENWRAAWRMLSVQMAALLAAVAVAYDYLPMLQQYLPADWMKWGALIVIAARLIKQEKLNVDQQD